MCAGAWPIKGALREKSGRHRKQSLIRNCKAQIGKLGEYAAHEPKRFQRIMAEKKAFCGNSRQVLFLIKTAAAAAAAFISTSALSSENGRLAV